MVQCLLSDPLTVKAVEEIRVDKVSKKIYRLQTDLRVILEILSRELPPSVSRIFQCGWSKFDGRKPQATTCGDVLRGPVARPYFPRRSLNLNGAYRLSLETLRLHLLNHFA